ncbi:MAG: methyltransferase [Alphaproteobacteria bacterium]|nr:methyltransferase [Alphaproteobacteria bacterium]
MIDNIEHTTLFNGNVTVYQPVQGYRFALDSLVLAAFTPAKDQQTVLELGIGVGAASLALAFQHPNITIHGIDIQTDILHITQQNIDANGWADRFKLFNGNLTQRLVDGHYYDHVIMNPPFFEENTYTESPYKHKTLSHGESDGLLKDWIHEAHRTLKSRGYVTIVHTARRLDEILSLLTKQFGGIEVFPLWSKLGSPAKRVLVRARKSVNSPMTLHAGLVLHQNDGSLTTDAANIIHLGQKVKVT